MDIHLYDKSKLTFFRTKDGVHIALWRLGTFADGHGWLEVTGALLDERERAALIEALTPEHDNAA